jgi:hypothetical protein
MSENWKVEKCIIRVKSGDKFDLYIEDKVISGIPDIMLYNSYYRVFLFDYKMKKILIIINMESIIIPISLKLKNLEKKEYAFHKLQKKNKAKFLYNYLLDIIDGNYDKIEKNNDINEIYNSEKEEGEDEEEVKKGET